MDLVSTHLPKIYATLKIKIKQIQLYLTANTHTHTSDKIFRLLENL